MDVDLRKAPCVWLLSTFRVSSINYSPVSIVFRFIQEAQLTQRDREHCQLKSCKMMHTCSTDCIWKGLQPMNDRQDHSRSLPWDINSYFVTKLRRHMTLTTPTWVTEVCSFSLSEDISCTVSWNRVKWCTNVRRIAFEKAYNRWMTVEVIQGHCRCCHLIGHIRFPISLPL